MYKKREWEPDLAVEAVCKERWALYREKERSECSKVEKQGDVQVSVSYDGACAEAQAREGFMYRI